MHLKFYLRLCTILLLLLPFTTLLSQELSKVTMQQIQLLEEEKATRTPAQRKMDSQLLLALQENRGQKIAGLSLEPAKINADAAHNLQVDISGIITDNLLNKIKTSGGKIIYASPEYRTVRATINLMQAEAIAAMPEVTFIQPAVQAYIADNTPLATGKKEGLTKKATSLPLAERTRRIRKAVKKYLQEQEATNPLVLHSGGTVSEGDRAHRADDARNTWGHFGEGIKIGVLSDTYNRLGGAAADVAAGELPGAGNPEGNTTPVTVVEDYTASGNDEGRAMLQLIHDLVPKAQLFYATAFGGSAAFANNIKTLRTTYGCDIIIDDVSYRDEPIFQDGIIAQAVNFVTANGALYFSSAANSGSLLRGTSGTYEGDFNDTGSPAFIPDGTAPKVGTVHNFGTATAPVTGNVITLTRFYTLFWSDSLGKSANDYDLFLVTSTGTIRARATNVQNGAQDPFEYIGTAGVAGDRLVVFKTTGAQNRAFHLGTNRGTLTYATSGETHGHSCAVDAYGVAATPAAASNDGMYPGPFPNAFNAVNQVEGFSSDGFRRIFFNADSSAVTPGNFLFGTNGGLVRIKPDITAADGTNTTVPGFQPFYGTSAAAPHAGAIAALLKSARPSITPAEIRSLLTSTALDIHSAGVDNVSGAGILQAYQAMQALNPTPLATLTTGTITFSEAAFSNGNGFVDPGETADLMLQLKNLTAVSATNSVVTLSTSTSGITITNGRMPYGNIAANSNATNTTTPFHIGINSSVPCGTVIKFTFTVSFGGGLSPRIFPFTTVIGKPVLPNAISATLGGTPPASAVYTATSGQQTGRVARTGTQSTCAATVAAPGLTATTGARQYDAYTFTNPAISQCVTVTLNSANGNDLYTVAYNNNGFVPSNPSTNFLAAPGSSGTTQQYSFTVVAGQKFTVVVHDVNVTPASNSPYTLSVSFVSCATGPSCTTINPSPSNPRIGAVGAPYIEPLRGYGGSGYFTYALSGTLPAGLTFTDSTISGIPTQSGRFPLTFTVTDATGCQAASRSYNLIIASSTIAATAGTPQSANTAATFAQQLQATVKDSTNVLLAGVKVIFTAPASGASGTFAGGVLTDTALTNASGVATADVFTANGTSGSYTVTASVAGIATPANFSLNNTCATTYVVTSNADSGPGTLREALSIACPNLTVSFSSSVSQIILTSGDLMINKGVTINGRGANNLRISGNNAFRVFNISANSDNVNISGITIRDTRPGANATYPAGGGVLINSGIVTIINCYLTNNNATSTTYGEGGAIDIEGGSLTVNKCTIANNTAGNGGGINNYNGTLSVVNSTISSHTIPGYGGGICSYSVSTITNSTVVNNSASTGGNIAQLNGGATDQVTIGNTIVAGGTLTGVGTGPDIATTTNIVSANYNLIQNVSGANITGVTTNNITGVSARVLPLALYGGFGIPLHPLMSNSQAINAGNPALTASDMDQRDKPRRIGSGSDIGAFEANYVLTVSSGFNQSAGGLSAFANPLRARVRESGLDIAGDTVVFTAPASGASGTFPGGVLVAKVVTDAGSIATAPTFSSNNTMGTYNVVASIGSAFSSVNFQLNNTSVLLVVFGSVTAQVQDCAVLLQWTTLSERDAKDYTIEYSTDGMAFSSITTLAAKGTTSNAQQYSYTHTTAAIGTLYYRIRQTDKNGVATYTKVLTAVNNCSKQLIVVRPNPVKDRLTVQIAGVAKQTLLVYDVAGRKMTEQVVSGGTHTVDVKNWSKGVYTLTLVQDGKTVFTTRVVKE